MKATFDCAECGGTAATVYYLPPGARDPRHSPEGSEVPAGVERIGEERPRISIVGGPVQVTISIGGDWSDRAIEALSARDVKALRRVDREFAPFWCYRCDKAYCDKHWRTGTRYDEGFFDCIEGFCPRGHRQTLMD